MPYRVEMSDEANFDFKSYITYISLECDAPLTAIKHYAGIADALKGLERNPFINPIVGYISLKQYGTNVRRENYKKMAIIYTIHENVVYVHRILAGSVIIGLN